MNNKQMAAERFIPNGRLLVGQFSTGQAELYQYKTSYLMHVNSCSEVLSIFQQLIDTPNTYVKVRGTVSDYFLYYDRETSLFELNNGPSLYFVPLDSPILINTSILDEVKVDPITGETTPNYDKSSIAYIAQGFTDLVRGYQLYIELRSPRGTYLVRFNPGISNASANTIIRRQRDSIQIRTPGGVYKEDIYGQHYQEFLRKLDQKLKDQKLKVLPKPDDEEKEPGFTGSRRRSMRHSGSRRRSMRHSGSRRSPMRHSGSRRSPMRHSGKEMW